MSEGNGNHTPHDQRMFWGCFIALITTAFGFIGRVFLVNTWGTEFGLDSVQKGSLLGIGIWPFAVSIIGFSLIIDKIGYKVSMYAAFLGHITWVIMGVAAYFISQGGNQHLAYQLLYWGSLILALANGTVEAFINPVVATMFSKEKTKWLNILHAGWPGGLVIAGMVTIFIDTVPWWIKIAILAVPAVVYFIMLVPLKFPVQEREAAGVSYRDMLGEFGFLGASVVGVLVTLQLIDFFGYVEAFSKDGNADNGPSMLAWLVFGGIGALIVAGFSIYTRSLGRFLLFFMILIMMPLATTEIGTDGWITGIMEGVLKDPADPTKFLFHSGWILVYTSAIMMVLRFFAGPIVHTLSPLGLLAASTLLAIAGLFALSSGTSLVIIFLSATLYGFGKTFFWPTMLGVVSEQMPKGGAMTLNGISGIGMLAVGVLGTPYIGSLQADKQIEAVAVSEVAKETPGLLKDGTLTVLKEKTAYGIINYDVISDDKIAEVVKNEPEAKQQKIKEEIKGIQEKSNQKALASMTIFPAIMLIGYIILILYFKSQGGYKAEVLTGHKADDDKFTGGVAGAVE